MYASMVFSLVYKTQMGCYKSNDEHREYSPSEFLQTFFLRMHKLDTVTVVHEKHQNGSCLVTSQKKVSDLL
jgi:hypothetical protein